MPWAGMGPRRWRFRQDGLDPGEDIGREQRPRAVVGGGVAFGVEPAVRGEMDADLGLEVNFFVEAHGNAKCKVLNLIHPPDAMLEDAFK